MKKEMRKDINYWTGKKKQVPLEVSNEMIYENVLKCKTTYKSTVTLLMT